jgi:hypothetical protein
LPKNSDSDKIGEAIFSESVAVLLFAEDVIIVINSTLLLSFFFYSLLTLKIGFQLMIQSESEYFWNAHLVEVSQKGMSWAKCCVKFDCYQVNDLTISWPSVSEN